MCVAMLLKVGEEILVNSDVIISPLLFVYAVNRAAFLITYKLMRVSFNPVLILIKDLNNS